MLNHASSEPWFQSAQKKIDQFKELSFHGLRWQQTDNFLNALFSQKQKGKL